ncbi:hypothetical protein SULI_00460 [Saccharolobus solfataricus]|nr:hypothetical protein [Saccharolobus solfataricus]AKA72544.1 hypothetical protein SULB_0092 [Saccharolobus solfataricus]AKA75243.1 hypothetical protein SULC_0091 [Saccharolobus solfataricus]AKA77936.1 hypothetical protein SULA_0091 [Saccharolobus solfataricus]AZF67053.1 hypothetical protein SULG_00460 [Saccharolobus solfataricus]AZF69673.1 hypothetical protein SULH_00460 [Saccharolobus solfataricus]
MRSVTISILALIITWGILGSLIITQANTTIVNTTTIPTSITYTVKLINSTTVANKTITHVYNYTLYYQVTKFVQNTVYVNISGNFTNGTLKLGNTVYIKKGVYEVNLLYQPLSIYYPFIEPSIIFNTSYGIISPNETIALVYKGKTFNMINGVNYTSYNYSGNVNGQQISVNILQNGIISKLENGSLELILESFSNLSTIPLTTVTNSQYMNFLNRSYLYAVYNYSPLSNSLIPEGYLQISYPVVIGNNTITAQITQIQLRAGKQLALPASLLGEPVNFVLYINQPQNIPTSFIVNVGAKNITWNSNVFTLVGESKVSTPIGTFIAYQYVHNISQNQAQQVLYFTPNGTLIKEEVVEIINSTTLPSFSLSFAGNTYISPFETYPNVFNYTNTSLPYKVIAPNLSFTISIVITIIIVAILVVLHKRD